MDLSGEINAGQIKCPETTNRSSKINEAVVAANDIKRGDVDGLLELMPNKKR